MTTRFALYAADHATNCASLCAEQQSAANISREAYGTALESLSAEFSPVAMARLNPASSMGVSSR